MVPQRHTRLGDRWRWRSWRLGCVCAGDIPRRRKESLWRNYCVAYHTGSLLKPPFSIHRESMPKNRDGLLVRRRTRHRKVASSNPCRSGGRIFFSGVNFVCWLLLGVRTTPVLPQWHVKDPDHSAKSADGRLHLKGAYTFESTMSRRSVGTRQMNSSGNALSQSSQLAEPLWTDPGLRSSNCVRDLISI